MKTEFLKGLGIEDKEVINAIMAENGKDITNAKGELTELKNQVTDLQSQLNNKTSELETLKETTKDYNLLNDKIKQLELEKNQLATDKAQLTIDLDTKVAELQKGHAIETEVRDAKARNLKAVMAQLDMEKITYKDGQLSGLSEQLDALKQGEETSFLFGEQAPGTPTGTHPNNPPAGGGTPNTSKTLAEAIGKAFRQ